MFFNSSCVIILIKTLSIYKFLHKYTSIFGFSKFICVSINFSSQIIVISSSLLSFNLFVKNPLLLLKLNEADINIINFVLKL